MSSNTVKDFQKFFENLDTSINEISFENKELIKMELHARLKETNNDSEIGYENHIKVDMMMRDLCDIFSEDGVNTSQENCYIFYQKDFDYDGEKGLYIFETDEDEDTFVFDLINKIESFNDFQDM